MMLIGRGRCVWWRVMVVVSDLVFGTPAGPLLDMWLGLPLPSEYVLAPAVTGVVLAGVVRVLRRARRHTRRSR